jgi:hypothetical protein
MSPTPRKAAAIEAIFVVKLTKYLSLAAAV